MKLKNKVALITGGAQGLGKAIALAMAKEGADIVICDINAKTLPGARAEIEATGARCLSVQCDVSSVDSVASLFKETISTFHTLDILARASWLARLLKLARRVSNAAFVLLVVLMIGLNLKTMAGTIGSFLIGTFALYVLAMVGAGYLLGGADKSTRGVFALGAGQRNIAAALVVASASFNDPAITVMLLVASITGLLLLLVLAKVMRAKATA